MLKLKLGSGSRILMLLLLHLCLSCGITSLAAAPHFRAANEQEVRWESAVSLTTDIERSGKTLSVSATGFLYETDSDHFLITAGHVARETQLGTLLRVNSSDGICKHELRDIGMSDANSWRFIDAFDVAALPVRYEPLRRCRFISIEQCASETIPRKSEIEFVGFPFGFGMRSDKLEPIIVGGAVASRELLSPFTSKADRVVLCTPPIADGTSGGPVFSLASTDEWQLVGVYVGNLYDRSGAKLSKIVPSTALRKLTAATECREQPCKPSNE